MEECMVEWLDDLFSEGIAESNAAVDNEEFWARESEDFETMCMHRNNAAVNRKYTKMLQALRDRIREPGFLESLEKATEDIAE